MSTFRCGCPRTKANTVMKWSGNRGKSYPACRKHRNAYQRRLMATRRRLGLVPDGRANHHRRVDGRRK